MGPEELIEHVNGIQYLEYPGVGWMKAVLLTDEALGLHAFSNARMALPALLQRYRSSPADMAIHRELISFFLAEWICYQTPESSCAWCWSEVVSRYQSVCRSTALQMIDGMVAASAAACKECLDTASSPEENAAMEADCDVDYIELAGVFKDGLFPNAQSYLYALTPPRKRKNRESWMRRIFRRHVDSNTQRADSTSRSLIGISDLAIGMFWIE